MTSKKIIVFNPTSSPLVYTEDGRSLGGGERCEVDRIDAVGQGLIDTDALIDVTPVPESVNKERFMAEAEVVPAKKATATRSGAPDQEDHA